MSFGVGVRNGLSLGLLSSLSLRTRRGGDSTPSLADFNFETGVYLENGASYALADAPGWVFSRTTAGYAVNAAGVPSSFAIDTPRITDLGLLIESAATNLCLRNTALNGAPWSPVNCNVTAGIADPAGGTSAFTLTATDSFSYCLQVLTGVPDGTYVNSAWMRRRTGSGQLIINTPNNSDEVKAVTSSWARFYASSTVVGGTCYLNLKFNTSGDAMDVWLPQTELGTVPTSEIVTAAASVTRGADVASLTRAGAASAAVTASNGLSNPVPASPLNLGASGAGAWVGNYVERVVIR